jgi:hypothetical protein
MGGRDAVEPRASRAFLQPGAPGFAAPLKSVW